MKVCRQIVRSLKNLKWLISVRRACASAYAKFNLNPSSRRCNANTDDRIDRRIDRRCEAVGVMKLGDVVSQCKYSDVHVMWSILMETEKLHHQQAAAMAN